VPPRARLPLPDPRREIALAGRRLKEAADLLNAVAPAVRDGTPDVVRLFSYAEARFFASQGQLDRARLRGSERERSMEGGPRAPVDPRLIRTGGSGSRPGAPTLEAARLGGPVGASEVVIVYDFLRDWRFAREGSPR